MKLHPTAIVDSSAIVEEGAEIEAFAVVGPDVRIGSGSRVGAHAVIERNVTIGRDNRVSHFTTLGATPQDLKYKGEATHLIIGDNNDIRESVTISRGTRNGGGTTWIGDHNFIMAYVHVAHDCRIGNHVILANGVQLGGHCTVGDHAVVGGLSAVHQFGRIGMHAFVGGGSMAARDVPPFCHASGNRAKLYGINEKGLLQRGFDRQRIAVLKSAYATLFRKGLPLKRALEQLQDAFGQDEDVQQFVSFVRASQRGICP